MGMFLIRSLIVREGVKRIVGGRGNVGIERGENIRLIRRGWQSSKA